MMRMTLSVHHRENGKGRMDYPRMRRNMMKQCLLYHKYDKVNVLRGKLSDAQQTIAKQAAEINELRQKLWDAKQQAKMREYTLKKIIHDIKEVDHRDGKNRINDLMHKLDNTGNGESVKPESEKIPPNNIVQPDDKASISILKIQFRAAFRQLRSKCSWFEGLQNGQCSCLNNKHSNASILKLLHLKHLLCVAKCDRIASLSAQKINEIIEPIRENTNCWEIRFSLGDVPFRFAATNKSFELAKTEHLKLLAKHYERNPDGFMKIVRQCRPVDSMASVLKTMDQMKDDANAILKSKKIPRDLSDKVRRLCANETTFLEFAQFMVHNAKKDCQEKTFWDLWDQFKNVFGINLAKRKPQQH